VIRILIYAAFLFLAFSKNGLVSALGPVGDCIIYGALAIGGAFLMLFALHQVVRALMLFGIFASVALCSFYVWSEFSNTTLTSTIQHLNLFAKPSSKTKTDFSQLALPEYKPAPEVHVTTLAEIEHSLGY
jgi:hypothetical protein